MIGDDEIVSKTQKKGHALEDFLNIEPTEIAEVEYEKPLTRSEDYDDKDSEIEEQVQEVFNTAMTGYMNLETLINGVEPQFRARLAEVALQYLKTGLDAANSKAKQKDALDKALIKQKALQKTGGKTTNNIMFTGDRNDFLRQMAAMMEGDKDEEAIEAEYTDESDKD